MNRFPSGGRKLRHPGGWPIAKPGQDIHQIGPQVHVQSSARLHSRGLFLHLRPSLGSADVQPVLPPQIHRPDHSFAPVRIHFHPATFQMHANPAPQFLPIVPRLRQLPTRLHLPHASKDHELGPAKAPCVRHRPANAHPGCQDSTRECSCCCPPRLYTRCLF